MTMIAIAAVLAAQAAAAPAPAMTVQQRFDAASKAVEEGRCKDAVAAFDLLEAQPAIRRSAVASAAVAVRKGSCLTGEARRDEGEALVRKGLPVLEQQGEAFVGDVVNARTVLAQRAALRLDYPAAIAEYRLALARATGTGRVVPLLGLSRLTMFDGDGAGVGYAEEALRIALASPDFAKPVLASVRTQYARALLNAGRDKDAYAQLRTSLAQQGGLTMKVGLEDLQTRSDLAIAAHLSGDQQEARRYLAYTGAGRTQESFDVATQIDGPPCGSVPGLDPDGMAVVEFALAEDGHVTAATPIYTRAGRAAALAFARSVLDWSWPAEAAAKLPLLFRLGTRVEMRCTRATARPPLTASLRDEAAAWLVPPVERDGRPDAVLAPLQRAAVERARAAGDPRALAAALFAWSENSVVPSRDLPALLDETRRVAIAAGAPPAVRTYLAIRRATADTWQADRQRKALRAIAEDPVVAGDPLSIATVRLLIAQPGFRAPAPADAPALLDQVIAAPQLPARAPVKVGALLQRANLLAAAGDVAGARAMFERTGLTGEQCALIEPVPAMRRSNSDSSDYPTDAIAMGFEGWLRTEFDIAANGATITPRVVVAYPPFIFDEAGIGIVRGARFTSSYRPEGNMACAANNRRIVFRLP